VNKSHRSPKGNRHMRRILNQAANAAVKHKGSIFDIVYRRHVPRMGHKQSIGAIGHRLCRLIWLILHQGVRYEERGPAVSRKSRQRRTAKMIRELRHHGYRIEPASVQLANPARTAENFLPCQLGPTARNFMKIAQSQGPMRNTRERRGRTQQWSS
jgi:hypothetical protein